MACSQSSPRLTESLCGLCIQYLPLVNNDPSEVNNRRPPAVTYSPRRDDDDSRCLLYLLCLLLKKGGRRVRLLGVVQQAERADRPLSIF